MIMTALRFCFTFLVIILGLSEAFTPSKSPFCRVGKAVVSPATFRTRPVYFFGRNDKEDGDGQGAAEAKEANEKRKLSIPFFGRTAKVKSNPDEANNVTTVVEKSPVAVSNGAASAKSMPPPKVPDDPSERAKLWRAQAERTRLEAERMDAELTLSKIEKLERQLKVAKTKGESIEELQRQLDNLQAKLRGEPPKPAVAKETPKPKVEGKPAVAAVGQTQTDDFPSMAAKPSESMTLDLNDFVDNENLNETVSSIDESPDFIKRLLASFVEIDFDTVDDINTTELALRVTMLHDGDFSFSKQAKPKFTEAEIEDAMRRLEGDEVSCPDNIVQEAAGDKRKMAQYILESEYYYENRLMNQDSLVEILSKSGGDEQLFQEVVNALNASVLDQFITASYPKCMRKEDAQEPTLAQVQSFASNVLPKVKFSASSRPEKVLGGYIVTGTYSYENGDELIDAIDKELERAGLADKMTVLLTEDFAALAEMAEDEPIEINLFGNEEASPILYITGPDIFRDPKPVQLSLVSGFGIASSWYFSIYPFLLNPALSQRVEEQLAVADAGMSYDLEWLTDLSMPLFFSFVGIQLIHELAHRLVASLKEVSSLAKCQTGLSRSRTCRH